MRKRLMLQPQAGAGNLGNEERLAKAAKPLECRRPNLDIFGLKNKTLEESEGLPEPEVLAQEIIEDLEAALGRSIQTAADGGGRFIEEQRRA